MTEDALEKLQEAISYRFGQVKLLRLALTHSSYANEQGCVHNERLEFLGDAVLELAVSQELFRRFPEAPEGVLTKMRAKLVSMPSLAGLARSTGLETCVMLGRGEESQGGRGRDSLQSDALEALLGAVFLDGGFAAASRVAPHIGSATVETRTRMAVLSAQNCVAVSLHVCPGRCDKSQKNAGCGQLF